MSLSTRQQMVRLARKFDALIVTDDVYDCLWWDAKPTNDDEPGILQSVVPRLVDVDKTIDGGAEREGADGFGNAMSNGSFSKICGPGVRTGWIEGNITPRYTTEWLTNLATA
jgi:DNA-binding transcriptional MocR family regulator